MSANSQFFAGIDFGTSGARLVVVDATTAVAFQTSCGFESTPDLAKNWQQTLWNLLAQMPLECRQQLRAIAINGTSSTVLLCDAAGKPLTPPLLYNDASAAAAMEPLQHYLATVANPLCQNTVLSATSSLVKLLWWSHQPFFQQAQYFLHQADWLSFLLHGQLGVSDYHNSLKLGYDVRGLSYPDWLLALEVAPLLPRVVPPGTPIAPLQSAIAQRFQIAEDCQVCAGTTDSIAAFLASGVSTPGEAVTSLGSTLVLKLLSETPVESVEYGIYSHRLGDRWLVGGASNTGGAVLRQFFTPPELEQLSAAIDPSQESGLDYYPLPQPGERFPVNNPHQPVRLTPRPADDVAFLHGLLESMARIESAGYKRLQQLGATPLSAVYTAGGGAVNAVWTAIRSRQLGVPVARSPQTEAAFGTALLAKQGCFSKV